VQLLNGGPYPLCHMMSMPSWRVSRISNRVMERRKKEVSLIKKCGGGPHSVRTRRRGRQGRRPPVRLVKSPRRYRHPCRQGGV